MTTAALAAAGVVVTSAPAVGVPAQEPAAVGSATDSEAHVTLTDEQYQQLVDEGRRRQAGQRRAPVAQPQAAQRPKQADAAVAHASALGVVEAERQARQAAAQHFRVDAAQRGTAAPDANVGINAAPPIGDAPDPALVDQCMTNAAEDEFGRVMNRFVYCKRFETAVNFYRIIFGVRVLIGRNEFTYELFAQGDDRDRRIRVFARVQEDSVDYEGWSLFDRVFVAPNIPLSFIINCVEGFETCVATRGPAVLPFVVWDNNDDWYYWDVLGRSEAGIGRDVISYARWYLRFEAIGPGVSDPGNSAARQIRCDSATYFRLGAGVYPMACVFNEATPHLTFSATDAEVGEVARHIRLAQDDPNATYPLLVPPGFPPPRDKRIPGKFVGDDPAAPGLHRIREAVDPEYQANRDHVRGACYKEGPQAALYLETGLPERPVTDVEECDEYPMASTLEGAAHPEWDFSVRAVIKEVNTNAGNRLRDYYVNDRILSMDFSLPSPLDSNDRFYMNIID